VNLPSPGQLLLGLSKKRGTTYPFKPKEKDIERSICDYLRIKGYFFWKQPSAGYFDPTRKTFRKHASPYVKCGVPDIIVVKEGQFIGLEVKSATGHQSLAQSDFERELRHAKGFYFLVRSIEDVQTALEGIQQHDGIHSK